MIQCVLGFATDLGRGGAWDEVYYTNHTTVNEALEAWTSTSGLIGLARTSCVGRRLACLTDQAYLYYARWSEVGVRGSSRLQQKRLDGYRASENWVGDAAVLRVLNANGKVKREVRLGGLPDNVVADNVISDGFIKSYIAGANAGAPASDTFLGKLFSIGGQIRFRTTVLGGANTVNIIGASKVGQYGLVTVETDRTYAWAVGQQVDLACRGQPQMRGRWKVATFANGSTFTVTLAGSERVSVPSGFTGQLTDVQMDGAAMASWERPFLSKHALGKKKFQPRGRQSVKLLRH